MTTRLFLYEAITAGAMRAPGVAIEPAASLLDEGLAMLRAVTEDFAAMEGMEVWGFRDARLADFQLPRREVLIHSASEERTEFQRLANSCDWALIIAPELDGMLEERETWLQGTNTALLSPSGEFLTIASSKHGTAQRLNADGVPVSIAAEKPYSFPLVLKRDDGAGSMDMQLIHNQEELESARIAIPTSAFSAPLRETKIQTEGRTQKCKGQRDAEKYRLEQFYPGLPASVAILCGPAGHIPLPPCEQLLDRSTFAYLGGRTPLAPELATRAQSLSLAAIAAMPPTTGYVGVDLVLGVQADGSQDVVIEINPRLTTSYVGLRQACRQNLAQAMLDVACGRPVDLSFRRERIEFGADGSPLTP